MVRDFTCVDTLATSRFITSPAHSGKHLRKLECRRLSSMLRLNKIMKPVGVETLGPWGPKGLQLIQEVGKFIAAETSEPRSTDFLLQLISIAIQRWNAANFGLLIKVLLWKRCFSVQDRFNSPTYAF